MREHQTQRRTYYGKENGLVVSPGEQHSGVEMVLHCRDKSQKEAHHHDGGQEGAKRRKADVHTERAGWGMFESVKR